MSINRMGRLQPDAARQSAPLRAPTPYSCTATNTRMRELTPPPLLTCMRSGCAFLPPACEPNCASCLRGASRRARPHARRAWQLDPAAHLALKHNQLTSEHSILSLESADRPEG